MQRRQWSAFVGAAALVAVAGPAFAQGYPNKPVELSVPFAPGGTTDIVARVVADPLGKVLGQPVVVINRAGGGGIVGAAETARSAPDGYKLGVATVSSTAANPAINPKTPYNPITDFTPIINLAATPNVIAVNPNFPAKDYKTFLAVLKANPGKYSYASSGTCGFGHMLGEQFKVSTKTFMVHIPYRGAGPALNDVLAGQVPIMVDNLPSSMPYIKAGKLRPIVVAWNKRVEGLPNVPTFGEMGLKEPNDPAWYGLVAPAGTPDDVIAKLNGAVVKALQDKGFVDRLQAAGAEPSGNTPAQHAAEIKKEFDKMKNLVKVQNIKLEQ